MSDIAPFTANGKEVPESTFQALALNTQQNVVIEACAGSGKTWLLVARMLKLLLQGTAPAHIVAITFTRKAAQEMKQRLGDMLDELHHAPTTQGAPLLAAMNMPLDAAVQAAIEAAWQRCRAQGEWPSIMTFHEWFGELRQNAPLSSLANAGASLSEDEFTFKTQAWQQFWDDTHTQAPLHEAMQTAVAGLGLNGFETALKAMLERRAEWLVYTQSLQASIAASAPQTPISQSPAQLAQAAYVASTQVTTSEQLWQAVQALIPRLKTLANPYLTSKTATAIKRGEGLQAAIERWQDAAMPALLWQLQNAVQQLMQPISMAGGAVVNTKYFNDMLPRLEAGFMGGLEGFVGEVEALHAALQQLHHQASLLRLLPVHQAVLECGSHLIAVYQANKQAQRLMDFADVEMDALTLLSMPRSEFDASTLTRHVLLDEFQDTNPVQWQALQAFVLPLLAEAAAGGQAASIFVVGDPKQSIYRFRRADPKLFSHVQRTLQADYGAVLLKTQRTRRNAHCVNQWVNAVFAPPAQPASELFSEQFTLSAAAGQVGVLPLLSAEELDDGQSEAQQVVQTVRDWKRRNPQLDWSQAMVLGRKRDALAPIAAALHACGIASVSADRGGFFALPEIADTISLLSALNNPADSLALLAALRSPLFAVSDGQLSELLIHSSTATTTTPELWLGIGSLQSPWAQGADAWLRSWQALCSTLPMHDALDAMMHQAQWAQRFARLIPERSAAIEANLAQLLVIALSVNQGRYPSLPRFVQATVQLRESDALAAQTVASADAVRLYTIHSAKGLEADCVVMVGLYGKNKNADTINVLLDWPADQAQPRTFAMQLCAPAVLAGAPVLADIHARETQANALERDTLLYVAMTRAVSELWISATVKKTANTVYERMASAFTQAGLSQANAPMDAQPAAMPMRERFSLALPPLATQPAPHAIFVKPVQALSQATPQALGVLMHSLLEQFMRHGSWPSGTALDRLALAGDIPLETAQTLLKRCQSMIQGLGMGRLVQQTYYLAIEQAIAYQGQQLRPDLVAYQLTSQTAWVIDYKYSFEASSELAADYASQLTAYIQAIQAAGYAAKAYIATLAGQCWQLQAGQGEPWVLANAPWHASNP